MSQPLFDLSPAPMIPVVGRTDSYPIGRIFCVGRNYAAHAAEMGVEVDREQPFYFTKSACHTVLSGTEIPYPRGTENFHHEMELAVAIGAPLTDPTPEAARAAIFGYGCALDMTRRDLQLRERQKQRPWSLGKDLEAGSVFASLTVAAEWGEVEAQRIWLSVNDDIRQDATLAELVWSVEEIICHLSGYYHLRPGDLILTGTPAGVGPVVTGDRIEGGIDGLTPVRLALR
ncbi:fumarylacetoacetate hydrolase family protein [Phaeobacter porticola]|uniref:Fumarylacetoacetate hydrolase family protein n=1 Tax=Phaeobacter porticola TaxID=1844006 RepID=A0A1L3I0N9_9RHOB|nr:fumarylacetoacetate hydrolase family protein [Phaeobacter porticola]APG45517.1 fumarylacetoacetate hydrolase family protein [Phaeobacter porticola]